MGHEDSGATSNNDKLIAVGSQAIHAVDHEGNSSEWGLQLTSFESKVQLRNVTICLPAMSSAPAFPVAVLFLNTQSSTKTPAVSYSIRAPASSRAVFASNVQRLRTVFIEWYTMTAPPRLQERREHDKLRIRHVNTGTQGGTQCRDLSSVVHKKCKAKTVAPQRSGMPSPRSRAPDKAVLLRKRHSSISKGTEPVASKPPPKLSMQELSTKVQRSKRAMNGSVQSDVLSKILALSRVTSTAPPKLVSVELICKARVREQKVEKEMRFVSIRTQLGSTHPVADNRCVRHDERRRAPVDGRVVDQ